MPCVASNTARNEWERVMRSLPVDSFALTFKNWMERCDKCMELGRKYVEKASREIVPAEGTQKHGH